MKGIRKHSKLLLVAVSCLAIGAGASAIASAGAAGVSKTRPLHGLRARGLRREAIGLLARRAVHADAVVWTRQGFVTITFDRGTVESVNGQQLTILEGLKNAAYKQVVLTIPTTARIRDNRALATLSQLTQGQRVIVVQAPSHTFVIAHTPTSTG